MPGFTSNVDLTKVFAIAGRAQPILVNRRRQRHQRLALVPRPQDHAGREIVPVSTLHEYGGEGRTRIATRLLKLAQDIGHGRQPEGFVNKRLRRELAKRGSDVAFGGRMIRRNPDRFRWAQASGGSSPPAMRRKRPRTP
jgi:hypothetical protein